MVLMYPCMEGEFQKIEGIKPPSTNGMETALTLGNISWTMSLVSCALLQLIRDMVECGVLYIGSLIDNS